MKHYDTLIVGGGIGGLMAAYGLRAADPDMKIAILDKGKTIDKRFCPSSKKGISCIHCKICDITNGYAGAGSFSDGKYNLGTSYGGTLGEELGELTAMEYINKVADLLDHFTPEGINIPTYGTDEGLKLLCLQNNLKLLDMNVKHLGTDNNLLIMTNLINWLEANGVDLYSEADVTDLAEYDGHYTVSTADDEYDAKDIILATGRNGADFIKYICEKLKVETESNAVDIGVRVEMKDSIWSNFSSKIYEPKILYRTKTFEDRCRMFCFNQGGIVSAENNDGIITANGHSFSDKSKKTENCNFAILCSIKFTEPFNNPTEYAKSFSRMANLISNGNVLVQRFGDLTRGRRSTEAKMRGNSVRATLSATAGDLSLALPHRILTNIIETVYQLDRVAPGTANDDTLLYGIESKYYSLKPKHNEDFEIKDHLYLIGDGSGIARGLSQSGAMGLYVADKIIGK